MIEGRSGLGGERQQARLLLEQESSRREMKGMGCRNCGLGSIWGRGLGPRSGRVAVARTAQEFTDEDLLGALIQQPLLRLRNAKNPGCTVAAAVRCCNQPACRTAAPLNHPVLPSTCSCAAFVAFRSWMRMATPSASFHAPTSSSPCSSENRSWGLGWLEVEQAGD